MIRRRWCHMVHLLLLLHLLLLQLLLHLLLLQLLLHLLLLQLLLHLLLQLLLCRYGICSLRLEEELHCVWYFWLSSILQGLQDCVQLASE